MNVCVCVKVRAGDEESLFVVKGVGGTTVYCSTERDTHMHTQREGRQGFVSLLCLQRKGKCGLGRRCVAGSVGDWLGYEVFGKVSDKWARCEK